MRAVFIVVVPGVYLGASLWARDAAGPFWMWHTLDPAYFYLLDSLNLVNLTTPGVMIHPGTTVQVLGALVLKALYPLTDAEGITAAVLANPEYHLRAIGSVILILNAGALAVLGAVVWRAYGSRLAVVMAQAGPFLTMLVFKHGLSVKPEALLIFTMAAAAAVAVAALRPVSPERGALEAHRLRYAAAFGLVAGFAVATKVIAAPVLLFPVFLLGSWRALSVYAIAAVFFAILFTLPAGGAYPAFFEYLGASLASTGDYTSGAGGVADWARYPGNVYKLLVRPLFSGTIVISVVALVWEWRHWRRGFTVHGPEVRLLAGIVLAMTAQVLVVAKQPTAYYMVPAWMLVPLAWVMLTRLAGGAEGRWTISRHRFAAGVGVALAALGIAQGFAVARVGREFTAQHAAATALDSRRFARCARIYFYAASDPAYALQLGDFVTGGRFGPALAARFRDGDYWFENWWQPSTVTFRGWSGPMDLAQETARTPCVVVRGLKAHAGPVMDYIQQALPGLILDGACSTRMSLVLTNRVGCDGPPREGEMPDGKREGKRP